MGKPSGVDRFVGKRIRERRKSLGLKPQDLGEAVGLPAQQVYRYERGAQSVSAGLVFEIAAALDTWPNYFFEGFEAELAPTSKLDEFMLDLAKIESKDHLAAISQLIRALSLYQVGRAQR